MEIIFIALFIFVSKFFLKQKGFVSIKKLPISSNKNLRYDKNAFTELYYDLKK